MIPIPTITAATTTAERIVRHEYDRHLARERARERAYDARLDAEYAEARRIERRVRRVHGAEGLAAVRRLVDKVTNRPRPIPLQAAWEWAEAAYERGEVLT